MTDRTRDVAALIPFSPRKTIADGDRVGYGVYKIVSAAAGQVVRVVHPLERVPQGVMLFDAGANPQPRLTVVDRTSTYIDVSGDVAMQSAILYLV